MKLFLCNFAVLLLASTALAEKTSCKTDFAIMSYGVESRDASIQGLETKRHLSKKEAFKEWLDLSLVEYETDQAKYRTCLNSYYQETKSSKVKSAIRDILKEIDKSSPGTSGGTLPDSGVQKATH